MTRKTAEEWARKFWAAAYDLMSWDADNRELIATIRAAMAQEREQALEEAELKAKEIYDQWKSSDGPVTNLPEADRVAGRLAALQVHDAIRVLKEEPK